MSFARTPSGPASLPDVHVGGAPGEPELPLVSDGVQRYVWESSFGPILIEVFDGSVFVNGQRVESAAETCAGIGRRTGS